MNKSTMATNWPTAQHNMRSEGNQGLLLGAAVGTSHQPQQDPLHVRGSSLGLTPLSGNSRVLCWAQLALWWGAWAGDASEPAQCAFII